MKKVLLKFFIFFTYLSSSFCYANLVETVKKVKPAVVGIGTYTPTGRPKNVVRGTGFVIGDGKTVVTNHHVAAIELNKELNQKLRVFAGSGKQATALDAELVASSQYHDLAILKITNRELPAMKLAENHFAPEGLEIAFTGFPIGSVLGLYPATHRGIIAAVSPVVIPHDASEQLTAKALKRLRNPYLVYQLDATAYPGNSGSPLYNQENGEVIGVINKVLIKETKESVLEKPSGITYAIPIKHVRELLNEVKS